MIYFITNQWFGLHLKWLFSNFITTSFSYLSGINEAGTGPRGSAELDIFAKPTFVQNLPPQTGYLSYSDQVELICQVISKLIKSLQLQKYHFSAISDLEMCERKFQYSPRNYLFNNYCYLPIIVLGWVSAIVSDWLVQEWIIHSQQKWFLQHWNHAPPSKPQIRDVWECHIKAKIQSWKMASWWTQSPHW